MAQTYKQNQRTECIKDGTSVPINRKYLNASYRRLLTNYMQVALIKRARECTDAACVNGTADGDGCRSHVPLGSLSLCMRVQPSK